MKRFLKLFCLLLIMSISLTACGGGASTSAINYAVLETTAASYDAGSPAMATYAYAEEAVNTEMGADNVLGGTSEVSVPQNTNRKLIRTVSLHVETDDFDTLLTKLQEQIASLSGYVEQSDTSGKSMQNDRSRRRAYITVRVPSTSLDQFVVSVEAEGNVTNKTETTTDVTLQYSDLESRKKSLNIEQERIFALLEKADTLEAIIALEERLSEIRYELESMESKLRLYDNQVEYSTIQLNIEEVKIYTPTAPETVGQRIRKEFTNNLENTKTFCVNLFVGIISLSPIWIPLFVIAGILSFLIGKKKAAKNVRRMMSKLPFPSDRKTPEESSGSGTHTEQEEQK